MILYDHLTYYKPLSRFHESISNKQTKKENWWSEKEKTKKKLTGFPINQQSLQSRIASNYILKRYSRQKNNKVINFRKGPSMYIMYRRK